MDCGADFAGDLFVGDDFLGSLDVDGILSGDVDITDDMAGTINALDDMDGQLLVGGSMSGDFHCDEYLNGLVQIVEATTSTSNIDLVLGINSGGTVEINSGGGDFDANGAIEVGTSSSGNIEFDGNIRIFKCAGSSGGDLEGTIVVRGCDYSDGSAFDICICGNNNGVVKLYQKSCTWTHTWSCVTGCYGLCE